MDYEGNKVTHRAAKELLALVLWAVVGSACWAETSIEKLQFNFYGSFIHTQKIPNALFYFDEIAKGDSFDLRKAMRNHDIDIIVLSSMGGSVSEGLQMGGIIHDNNLKTYVPKRGQLGEGNCASACALMFFGGVAREVGGKLGVHQFYSQNFNESAKTGDIQGETQFIAGEIIGFLNSFNTPPFVLEKMFQQSDMYYFSEAEIELLGASEGTLSHSKTTQINSFIRSLVEASDNIDVESSQKALTHVAPEPAPAVISPEEAEATYAATGVWLATPEMPLLPPKIALEDVYTASIDARITGQDAFAMGPLSQPRDVAPSIAAAPTTASGNSDFNFDQNGLVVATPEGATTPEGALVFLGRPARIPPAIPERLRTAALTPETARTAETLDIGTITSRRPKTRPETLVVDAQPRWLTELAKRRPKLRRKVEKEVEKAGAVLSERPSQEAAEASLPAFVIAPDTPETYVELIVKLREAVEKRPEDLQGATLLATHEMRLGNAVAAHAAQADVIRLKGAAVSAEDYATYADMLIIAAGGYVSPEAEGALARVLRFDPKNGVARYYSGLMMMQVGRPDVAFRAWAQLLQDSGGNEVWVVPIREQIEDLAFRAGVKYELPPSKDTFLTGPSVEDIENAETMSEEERTEMIRNMVGRLSDRLATIGGSAEEWARLIGALGFLGEADQAALNWQNAKDLFRDRPNDLAIVRGAARKLGITQ